MGPKWICRRAHSRRLPTGRSTYVRESWILAPPRNSKNGGVYRQPCPRCGSQIVSIHMPNGGWAHFEGSASLSRVKHPCFTIGLGLSQTSDDLTGDLFNVTDQ